MSMYPANDPMQAQQAQPGFNQPMADPNAANAVQLQIEVLAGGGSLAGRQMAFSQGPVKFGRDTGNAVLLDNPAVSRFHGEFSRGPDGQWVLTNYANNGTKLGGKKVADTPVPVTRVAEIKTGNVTLMRVTPFLPAVQEGFDESGQPIMSRAEPTVLGGGKRKRMGLYIGIGAWLLLMAGLAVFFATLQTDDEKATAAFTRLTPDQVRAEIMEPPAARNPNASAAERELNQANEAWVNSIAGDPAAAYQAIDHYKRAISFRADGEWQRGEGLMYKRFTTLQQSFADEIAELYENAARSVESKQWAAAIDRLNEVKNRYPVGSDSDVTASVQQMLGYARSQQAASN